MNKCELMLCSRLEFVFRSRIDSSLQISNYKVQSPGCLRRRSSCVTFLPMLPEGSKMTVASRPSLARSISRSHAFCCGRRTMGSSISCWTRVAMRLQFTHCLSKSFISSDDLTHFFMVWKVSSFRFCLTANMISFVW